MEAAWGGNSLALDGEALTLEQAGSPSIRIPLTALSGFTLVETGPAQSGQAAHSTPNAELVVGWRQGEARRSARMPVPRDALQVQLFLARLAQVRPEADLRSLPPAEALQRLGIRRSDRAILVLGVLALLAAAIAGLLLLR